MTSPDIMNPIRGFLTGNLVASVGLSVAVIGASIWFAAASLHTGDPPAQWQPMVYFYDLNTKQLFPVPVDTQPPIETDSGDYQGMPAGVRAHVYACGDGGDWFIGYLETTAESLPSGLRPAGPSRLVMRREEGGDWHDPTSESAGQVLDFLGKCSQRGVKLRVVHPLPQEQ